MPRILVGRLGAPHGVRGELRLQSFTQAPEAIASYGPLVTGDGRQFRLTNLRSIKDAMLVVRVDGVADRTAAERLTHTELFIERDALPPTGADEFYIADLIGLDAVDAAGVAFGTIVDVPNYGSGDLIEVRPASGQETLLFPFTRDVVPDIDVAGRRVTILPPEEIEDPGPGEPVR